MVNVSFQCFKIYFYKNFKVLVIYIKSTKLHKPYENCGSSLVFFNFSMHDKISRGKFYFSIRPL